jgi:hypothetical protein
MMRPEDEFGTFRAYENLLEDGRAPYNVCFSTPYGLEWIAEPPSEKCAEALADALNLVRARILDCGSDQEVFRLMDGLYKWRLMK